MGAVWCWVMLLVGVVWSYRVVVSQAFWCQFVSSCEHFHSCADTVQCHFIYVELLLFSPLTPTALAPSQSDH